MRAVVVGAGAVGQTYGWLLQKGGCEVTFLVREKYAEELQKGLWVYPQDKGPERWEGFEVVTSAVACDQVWFCVSSPALAHCPLDWPGALGIYLTPGLHDERLMRQHFAAADLVRGVIPFIAFQAPLPDESRPHAGVSWWFPPLMRLPFSGPRANEVTRRLPRAHMVASVAPTTHRGSAAILPAVAALEIADWSLKKLDRELAARGIREATDIAAAVHGLGEMLTPPPMALGLLAGLSPLLVPFDLETYLRFHFTKVGDQTRESLEHWIAESEERGLEADALRRLREGLR